MTAPVLPPQKLPEPASSPQSEHGLQGHARAPCVAPDDAQTAAEAGMVALARWVSDIAKDVAALRVEFESSRADLEALPVKQVTSLSRLDRRKAEIMRYVAALNYSAQAIPFGGKAVIKNLCIEDSEHFSPSTFDAAWKAVRADGLVLMADAERLKWEKSSHS